MLLQLQLKGPSLSRTFEAVDRASADVLTDPWRRRILLAFQRSELSLSDASKALEMSLSLLHHHVKRLLAAGFLEVVREVPRAGRAIRVYRAVHDSYFVPSHLMARTMGETLNRELRAALDDVAAHSEGVFIDFADDGRPRMRPVGNERRSPPWETWRMIKLGPQAAARLRAEQSALIRRFEALATDDGTPHLFHSALVKRTHR